MITPPRPVIDADDLETIGRRMAAASDDTQKRVLAYWQHQPFCEARRRSPPKRQTEVMDDRVNGSHSPRFRPPFVASCARASAREKLFMAWLNRWTVRLEHRHKSPKLCAATVQHLANALFRCFIIAAVKLDSAD
jgi:hypothetical protein